VIVGRLPRIRPITRAAIGAALVALDASGREEAMDDLEQEALARERRRIEREGRGSSAGRLRCGGCRRWLRAANEHCGCGFRNDIRGRRNVGGYA
jgi:hypothetical protein